MQFRKDINGLRAIAVMAVVLFHFNPSWMPGGFVGVDIFFVISGYLMTGIIFRGFEANNFSIQKFYIDRANRIIPALAMLCLFVLVFGWFFILPLDYELLGKHVFSSITFFSNLTYWQEAGYFDIASNEKWLLHTWSLSVEWQFYIIYPIILVILNKRISVEALKSLIIIGAFLSFSLSILAMLKNPEAGYYLLPTRAWEMMAGGIAYLYPFSKKLQSKLIEYGGVLLIVSSCFLVSKETVWPGYLALMPVFGAYLVIQSNQSNSFLTGQFLSQKLGDCSYSIYLWHWPIVVAINYFSLPLIFSFFGIAISIFLGCLSRNYIEKYRFKNNFSNLRSCLKFKQIYFLLAISFSGLVTHYTKGFEWHYDSKIIEVSREAENKNPYNCMIENKFPCYIGNKNNIKAIIIGDSHAESLTTALTELFYLNQSGVISLTKSACPFILNIKSVNKEKINDCLIENEKRLSFLKNNYKEIPVFWVARTAVYFFGQSNPERIVSLSDTRPLIYFSKEYQVASADMFNEVELNLERSIKEISAERRIFMVLPTPEMRKNVPRFIARSLLLGVDDPYFVVDKNKYFDRNNLVIDMISRVAKKNNATILDPTTYLCFEKGCISSYNDKPIYFDGDHLSEYGNKLLTPMFRSALY